MLLQIGPLVPLLLETYWRPLLGVTAAAVLAYCVGRLTWYWVRTGKLGW